MSILQAIFNFDPYLGFILMFLCLLFAGWAILSLAERVVWWILLD